MSTKPFWIVAGSAELIAVVVLVLSEWDMISDDNLTVKILALLLGPAIVCLYHITFIAPYTSYLRSQNVMQGIYIEDLLRMREEHRREMRRSQTLLNNLTAGTRNRTRKEMGISFVYFIADRAAGRVKIGISHDPDKRMNALQGANGGKLEIIATFQGDERHEQALHDKFKHLRLNGEWFRLTPEIERFALENRE